MGVPERLAIVAGRSSEHVLDEVAPEVVAEAEDAAVAVAFVTVDLAAGDVKTGVQRMVAANAL